MLQAGYMAKRISPPPGWLKPPHIRDVCSVGDCVNDDFADFVDFSEHNNYRLFDSPRSIQDLATNKALSLINTTLFYYEIYEREFDGVNWETFTTDEVRAPNVTLPVIKNLLGFDVVTFSQGTVSVIEHSPLSCNSLAEDITVNSHCLIETFDGAKLALESGQFEDAEPGPYRIFAVYSVGWPDSEAIAQ